MFKVRILSSFLLFLLFTGCKKEKGALDDLPPGKFDFVCIWNKNGVQDTVTGEVSGPYLQAMEYYFRVKQELGTTNFLKEFRVGTYKGMANTSFRVQGLYISSSITSSDHDSDNLFVNFQSGSTLNGTYKLTRKQ